MIRRPRRDVKGLAVAIGGLFVVMALMGMVRPAQSWPVITKDYGDFVLNSPGGSYLTDQVWDLTEHDLTISYSIDLRFAEALNPTYYDWVNPADPTNPYDGWWVTWVCPWVSVGLTGGVNGWMTSGCPFSWGGEIIQPIVDENGVVKVKAPIGNPNPGTQNLADKHNLQCVDGQDETQYDVKLVDDGSGSLEWKIVSRFGSGSNYGIWFDRDGVDPWQDDDPTTPGNNPTVPWGVKNGDTYNTDGTYDIVLTYHAISASQGYMLATVNGIEAGFYASWHGGAPDIYPAGKSISGDLTSARLIVKMWAPQNTGYVAVTGVSVEGVLATVGISIDIKPGSDPNSICLKDSGLLPVAIFGSGSLDVHDIVPDSLMLGVDPTYVDLAMRGPAKAPKLALSYEDVNHDGIIDVVGFFNVQELYADGTGPLTPSTTQLSLTGTLSNGKLVMGTDSVNVVQ